MMASTKWQIIEKSVLWTVLSIPGVLAFIGFLNAKLDYAMMMHISGEFAGRFLAITLLITPLSLMFPSSQITRWLLRNRRYFGVFAFAYTFLHTLLYIFEYPLQTITEEFIEVELLTGWIAFFIFIPLAITSTNSAIKRMGGKWKKLQRWVYLAAVMAFVHWAILGLKGDNQSMNGALIHFVPVGVLQAYRIWKQRSVWSNSK